MAIKFLNTATGITEAAGDNSTKIATTAYVDAAAAAVPIGDYVTLATTQTISGAKTFSASQTIFDGNVGIGTTSPETALQVGDGTADDTIRTVFSDGSYTDVHGYGLYMSRTDSYIRPVADETQTLRIGDNGKTWNSIIHNANLHTFNNDASEWMRITSTGNVGIGTTSPSAKLEIADSSYVDLLNLNRSGVNSIPLRVGSLGSGDVALDIRLPSVNSRVGVRGAMSIGAGYADGANTGINNGLVVQGNVGIGTTAPSKKLHVVGDSYIEASGTGQTLLLERANGQPTIKAGTTQSGHLILDSNAGHIYLNNYVNKNVLIATGGGNVGIGTTSPGARLEVKSAAPNTFFANFMPSTGSGYAKIYQSSNSHPALYMANAAGTATIVLNSSGVSYLTSGNIIIGGTADNGNLLQVQGTGYFLGNVGIGTSTVTNGKLVIEESGTSIGSTIRLIGTNTIAGASQVSHITSYQPSGGGAQEAALDFKVRSNADAYASPSTVMTLLGSGNVGIGTTSPAQKLQVNGIGEFAGALRITETGTSQNILIGNQNSGGTNTPAMINGVNGSLRFGKGNSWSGEGGTFTETMRVDLSGNVGIGTTSPGAKLQVGNGTFDANARVLHSDSTYTEMRGYGIVTNRAVNYYRPTADKTQILGIGNDGNTWNYISHNANYHTFSTDLAERMRIDLGGNVGIGTTSPLSILHVVSREIGNGANKGIRIENYNGTKDYSIRTGVSGAENTSLAFYDETAGANRIVITSGGNVGIGTTSPSTTLQLTKANTEVLANQPAWPKGILEITDTSAYNAGTGATIVFRKKRDSTGNQGNVGIGTTSPNQKLHVNGATQLGDINATTNFNTVALKVVEGTISTGPTLGSGTVGAQAVLYSNGAFGMYTGVSGTGNTWMQSQRNDANTATYNILLNPLGGNVGIGVTNPSARLHVDGTVKFSSSGDRIFIADGGNGTFELGDIDGVSDEAKIVGDGSNIIISNTGTETLTCNSNNRVGIGTTNPSYKLDVSGDINGTNVYSNKLFTNIEESVANITSYSASSDTIFLPIDNVYPSDDYISVDDYSNYALPIFTVGDQVVIKNSNDSSEVIMQLVYDENFFSDPSALYSNATVVSGTLSGDYLYELGYISSATVINIDTDLTTILSAGNYIILGGIEYLISAITPNSITINASVENIQFINTVGLSTDFAMVSYKSTLSNGIAVQETPVLGFNIQKNKTFLKGSIDFFDSDTNQFIGKDSGASSVSEATFNTTSGYRTLYNNTTGSSNSAFGYEALNFNTTGGQNIALGYQALFANTTGSNNIALGNQSSWSNVTGYDNISIGASSMTQNNSGIRNLAIGTSSLYWNIYGNNNIGLGDESFASNRFGSDNVSIGYRAAFNSGTTVNNSVFVGSNTKPQGSNQSNQIVIGYDTTGNGSNTVTIGNSLITNNYFNGAINSNSFKVKALNVAPATSTSAGITGEIRYTSDYIYVCVATNTWKRTLLSTW
jgi:hypothetical protein